MFMIHKNGSASFHADAEIAKTERLLADLKRIRSGIAPTKEELAAAPFLDSYELTLRQVPCLTGAVSGHPRLGDTKVLTSEVWVLAPMLGWARTYSRFYRLGRADCREGRVQ